MNEESHFVNVKDYGVAEPYDQSPTLSPVDMKLFDTFAKLTEFTYALKQATESLELFTATLREIGLIEESVEDNG